MGVVPPVVIACPRGVERARDRVRVLIANAPLDLEEDPLPTSDVRFRDE